MSDENMSVREFRDRMKESLDEFVRASEADGAGTQTAGDWMEDFIEFVTEGREAPPSNPTPPKSSGGGGILDLLDVLTGDGEED